MATCLLMAALGVCAQTQEQDSLRVINLQEVEVISTRATNSPRLQRQESEIRQRAEKTYQGNG